MSATSARDRKRYAEDPEYRRRRLAWIKAYRKANRTQINARRRLRWATDPDYREHQLASKRGRYRREYELRRLYGITLDEYHRLLARQHGRCAICNQKSHDRLQVDHCHRTKAVRRLLCGRCNRGLGHFRDDLGLLRSAASYLAAALRRQRARKARVRRHGRSAERNSR